MRDKSRFEETMDALNGISDKARRNARLSFEKASGEIWVDHPDAPDRSLYADDVQGYQTYLADCHSWAVKRYEEILYDLVDAATECSARMSMRAEAPIEPEHKDAEESAADTLAELMAEAEEARKQTVRIEMERGR